jgi:hypothetical protein
VKRIATSTDQRSIVSETNALLFANCDQAFFNSLLGPTPLIVAMRWQRSLPRKTASIFLSKIV